jgi:hypothetical protein
MSPGCKAIRLNLMGNTSHMMIAGDCGAQQTGMILDGRPRRKQWPCWGGVGWGEGC